jgi:predicted  nucleic acid-binding Zn-ribbon protein
MGMLINGEFQLLIYTVLGMGALFLASALWRARSEIRVLREKVRTLNKGYLNHADQLKELEERCAEIEDPVEGSLDDIYTRLSDKISKLSGTVMSLEMDQTSVKEATSQLLPHFEKTYSKLRSDKFSDFLNELEAKRARKKDD